METPKRRPSIKGKKKVGSADLAPTEQQPGAPEAVDEPSFQAPGAQPLPEERPSRFKRAKRPQAKLVQEAAEEAPADAVGIEGSEDEPAEKKGLGSSLKKARRSSASADQGRGRKAGLVVAAVLAVLVAAAALFVWNTYFRYDDTADIKGEWLVSDGSMVMVIDDQSIKMPDAVYDYSLDTGKKTITFTFAELSGGGSYDFSDGRKTLTVSEGQENVVETTFYKMSDKVQAKPRKLSGEKAEQALSKYGPQEQVAVPAADASSQDASGQGKSKAKAS